MVRKTCVVTLLGSTSKFALTHLDDWICDLFQSGYLHMNSVFSVNHGEQN